MIPPEDLNIQNNNNTTNIINFNNEKINKKDNIDSLLSIANELDLDIDAFKAIVAGFKKECEHGLNITSSGVATMIPSYVTRMPTGDEKGTFLALDLGGSNLRVSAVELLGKGQVSVLKEIRRTIPDAQKKDHQPNFSIGWLMHQTGICKGKVLRMAKGFALNNIDGQDLANLFHDAFKRKNINITYASVLSMARVLMMLILKRDYIAKLSSSPNAKTSNTLNRQEDDDADFMLVNTEIDVFGSPYYLLPTRFDKALDAHHLLQPGF
ncbi:hypothetical protein INT45_014097 [Circinella minor]|uniref:Phosphotransferase n=1 Tax=Circinella minor TaxID=1195481 RepID=A0A8H7VIW0_9FUNG|nr:hypothetical protein INT45_014097 [Circinella minor]